MKKSMIRVGEQNQPMMVPCLLSTFALAGSTCSWVRTLLLLRAQLIHRARLGCHPPSSHACFCSHDALCAFNPSGQQQGQGRGHGRRPRCRASAPACAAVCFGEEHSLTADQACRSCLAAGLRAVR